MFSLPCDPKDLRLISYEHRYVAECDGVVYKLGCPDDWLTGAQNRKEVERWQRMTPDVARWYAPVLDYDPTGAWLTMPLARPAQRSQTVLWGIDSELRALGIVEYDLKHDNIGVIDEKLLVLDYGFSREMQPKRDTRRTFCGTCPYCTLTYRQKKEVE